MRLERLKVLSTSAEPPGASWVLYWMQASVRCRENLALEYAAREASARRLPLVVVFGIVPDYPGAAGRAYSFLIEGLRDVAEGLRERGIRFLIVPKSPPLAALDLADRAALTVLDRGYTRTQVRWRHEFVADAPGPAVMIEDNVCLPVETAYPKAAVGARVLRPRIEEGREAFLTDDIVPAGAFPARADPQIASIRPEDLAEAGREFGIRTPGSGSPESREEPYVASRGGASEGLKRLEAFLRDGLERYGEEKNDPSRAATSRLSPYLHFGQISVREVARRALSVGGDGAGSFLEELLVRRELAVNYVHHHQDYDRPDVLPGWAKAGLDAHASDPRPVLYEPAVLEAGETHDPYWNACQREMVLTGHMHGYMRMYWGKKVIEWTRDWRRAWDLLIEWNDRYELDGRDPNGYAGTAWCFGMHDRPWKERAVFGPVRYMNAAGLERKFDIEAYVRDVERRTGGPA